MWTILSSVILGLLSNAGKLFDYFGKRSDNTVLTIGQKTTTGAQALLVAYVGERKVIAAERAAQHLSSWTAWMVPTPFALCILHFDAIVLDSTFLFNWQVAKLPALYDAMEQIIVALVIGVSGVQTTVGRIFSKR